MNEQQIELRFPVYMIGTERHPDGRMASRVNGCDWFLLYPSLEVAELYIEQSRNPELVPCVVSGMELCEVLATRPDVAGFLWNCLTFRHVQLLSRRDFEP